MEACACQSDAHTGAWYSSHPGKPGFQRVPAPALTAGAGAAAPGHHAHHAGLYRRAGKALVVMKARKEGSELWEAPTRGNCKLALELPPAKRCQPLSAKISKCSVLSTYAHASNVNHCQRSVVQTSLESRMRETGVARNHASTHHCKRAGTERPSHDNSNG
eukprot:607931-Pelagomonas_calceolata.AAC.8